MEIGPPVLEKKMFEGLLPYMGMAAINIAMTLLAQGVQQENDVAHPRHLEKEETSQNRNNIITCKQQQIN